MAQVGPAVTQLARGTQQNAALVEKSAAAAENLELQAQQLVKAVAVFKLAPAAARWLAKARRPAWPQAEAVSVMMRVAAGEPTRPDALSDR